jgi:hypothetical protein
MPLLEFAVVCLEIVPAETVALVVRLTGILLSFESVVLDNAGLVLTPSAGRVVFSTVGVVASSVRRTRDFVDDPSFPVELGERIVDRF